MLGLSSNALSSIQLLQVTYFKNYFRQSIDLYSSVQSPSLNFLGTPALSRFGSSFLSSSLTRRHTPEILPSYGKPLIPKDEPQQRRSSHSLLPPVPSRTSSLKKVITDQKSKDLHQLPGSGQSSFGQAVLNGRFCNPTQAFCRAKNLNILYNQIQFLYYYLNPLILYTFFSLLKFVLSFSL